MRIIKRLLKAIGIIMLMVYAFSFSTISMSNSLAATKKVSTKVTQEKVKKDNDTIPVIVQTTKGVTDKHRNVVGTYGGKLKKELKIIKGFAADLTAKEIEALAKEDDVKFISYDEKVTACLDVATQVVGAPSYWESGYTGKGITVAVIDSGIYPHSDLTEPTNRIIAFKDFVNKITAPYDDFGHGTHVAGIIAGNGTMSDGLYKGVAPEANLVGIKVLDNTGSGSTSTVIEGIEWAVTNKDVYGIDIINMSLGAPATESYTTDPLSQASEVAWKAGLVVVAAAGNDGPAEGTIRTPGINPNIITVGAFDDKGTVDTSDDTIADFSSRGPTIDGLVKPDVLAPGVNITSIMTDTSYLPKKNSGVKTKPGKATTTKALAQPEQTTIVNSYITMSGTSMATPMISGKIALMLEQDSTLTPDVVRK